MSDGKIVKRYRITSGSFHQLRGIEFQVNDCATEEEIAKAAFDAVSEWLDYGWEEVDDESPKQRKAGERE